MYKQYLLFLIALFVACSSAKKDDSASGSNQPRPVDLRIELGEGGGFTGLWNGYAVDSTGEVEELSGRTLGESRKSVGKVSPESMKELWDRIVMSGILSEDHTPETGNMTRSLTITANGKTSRFFWVPPSLPNQPAVKVDDVYTFLVRTLGKQN